MKEYLLISKGTKEANAKWNALTEQDWKPITAQFDAWIGGLAEKNLWVRGDRLTDQRRTIEKKNEVVVDGPFVETKEIMSGYFIYKAESLAHATEIAKGCPTLFADSLELVELIGERP